MKRNRISLPMLAALSVCGVVQSVAHAQGGVLVPEPVIAPAVKIVPHVVEYPAKKVEAPMPAPHAARPITATGHIVHVHNVRNLNLTPSPPAAMAATPVPMGMGGFVTPRPVIMSVPSTVQPSQVEPAATGGSSN